MRTPQEIIVKIRELKSKDFFGFRVQDLALHLEKDDVLQFCKPDADLSNWKALPTDEESVKGEILEYMPFAWEKANNNRGLSAARSIDHMGAWLWLLGLDKAAEQIREYNMYGKPQLRAICEAFEWDWRQWDDGRWTDKELDEGIAPPESVEPLDMSKEEAKT